MGRRVVAVCVVLAAGGSAVGQTGVAAYVGYNFTTVTFAGGTRGFEPPDTVGAVGINQFTSVLNGYTAIHNKDGSQTYGQQDNYFWNTTVGLPATAINPGGDSRVLYDAAAQRWVVTAFTTQNPNNTSQSSNNYILLGRTDGPDAGGPWRGTYFQTTSGRFADYPTLGMNGDALALGTNNFSGNTFTGVSLYTLPKSSLYTAATTPSTTNLVKFENLSASTYGYTLQPTTNYSPTATGTLPVEAISSTALNRIVRTTVSNTGTGSASYPTSSAVAIPITSFTQPSSTGVTQPGTSTNLAAGDQRIGSAALQLGNRIFLAFTIAGTTANTTAVRFTVLDATTNAVLNQQTLGVSGTSFTYPSVSANSAGDVVLGCTAVLSGPPSGYLSGVTLASAAVFVATETATNAWTFRTDSSGRVLPTLLATSGAYYTGSRWGDYSATTPDPADPGVFWTLQEFANPGTSSPNYNWATQASEIIVPKTAEARYQPSTFGNRAYTTAANWYAGTVPASTDHVIFSRWTSAANSQTVTTTADTTADRLSVRQTGAGTLTLSLGSGTTFTASNTGTATPSLAVAEFQGQARLTVGGGGTLSTQTAVVAGTAGGTGVLTIDGTGGTTWTNAGGLFLGGTSTAAGGQGTLTLTNGATATVGGLLTVYNSSSTLLNAINVGAAGAAATLTTAGLTNTGAGPSTPTVSLPNAASLLVLTAAGAFGGVIDGPGGVTKSGTGTQTLTGANVYTGATTVSGGTLALTGTGSIAASTAVTVTATLDATGLTGGSSFGSATAKYNVPAAQTLTGPGTVAGGLTVAGTVRPATTAATLTVSAGSASLLGGSTTSFRVTAAGLPAATGGGGSTIGVLPNPVNNSFLDVTAAGSTLAVGDGLNVVIDGTGAGFVAGSAYSYAVARAAGGIPTAGTGHTFTGIGFSLDPSSASLSTSGGVLYVNFTPVPEPALLLPLAAVGLAGWRRLRRVTA